MKKKTWGIILVVLGAMGLLGGLINGSIFAMGFVPMIGFLAGVVACFYFGIKFIKKGE